MLKMIEEGKISAAEGAELLRAMETKGERGPALEPMKGTSNPRWFRVRVTDMQTGRNKVNVNIPMGLVNVGIKIGRALCPTDRGQGTEHHHGRRVKTANWARSSTSLTPTTANGSRSSSSNSVSTGNEPVDTPAPSMLDCFWPTG